jgi:hypothetical protein
LGRENNSSLSPQCGDFFRGFNCLRGAETIGVDADKNYHVSKRPTAKGVLYGDVHIRKVEYKKATGKDRFNFI